MPIPCSFHGLQTSPNTCNLSGTPTDAPQHSLAPLLHQTSTTSLCDLTWQTPMPSHQRAATSATAIGRGTSVQPPAPPPSHVVTLSPNNFDAVVLNPTKFVLVEFYAPWCSFCQDLAPAYEQLGRAFRDEEKVVIAKLDASKHRELKEK
ncbi:unnamed protein product [Closterium sp. NIES-54]